MLCAVVPLSECLASVDSAEGRRGGAEYLASRPFPHYQPVHGSTRLRVRVDEDGTQTVARSAAPELQAVLSP